MAKKSKTAKSIPKTFFGRATRLVGTASVLIGREIAANIASQIKEQPSYKKVETRIKQAQDLVDSLSHLKGAAMKAGQLISLEMSDLLPPEVVEVLRTLHDSASFLPFDDIKKILRKELGAEKLKQLRDISPEPIASASIGQVHRATLNGQAIVLKIQYPGVASSIDSDLAMLKKMIGGYLALRGKAISFDGVFEELAEGLKLEVDYRKEAEFIQTYRQAFAGHDGYCIPSVFPEYSTSRVLALSFEEGERLNDWLKKPMDEATKHEFAHLVLRLLEIEFFEQGLVQTDPNYGNFLIREQGRKLVLLDFGAVRMYSSDFRQRVRALLRAAMDEDRQKIMEIARSFQLIDEREAPEIKEKFYNMLQLIVFMFRRENQPFKYANDTYLKKIRETTLDFVNSVQYTSPARQMLFLNRKLGGMYHLLKDADCCVDVAAFWERALDMDMQREH